jgi:coronin-7
MEVSQNDIQTNLQRFESPNASIQQGVVFLPKSKLDVRQIEIARCWRLNQTSIEPISFTLPRARPEFFQDDLFPVTRNKETPALESAEWLAGETRVNPRTIDLKPAAMVKCKASTPIRKVQLLCVHR